MKIGIDVGKLNKLNQGRGIGIYTKNLIEALKKYTKHEIVVIESRVQGVEVDLVHYPFFDFFVNSLPFKKIKPTVVTIHDVTPLLFSEHYPPGIKGRINLYLQKLSLKSVKSIITDSNNSKKDIKKILSVEEDKIFPVYLAADEKYKVIKDEALLKGVRKKFNLPEKYLLFVGNVNWNKNILAIAESAIQANVDLVLVGGGFSNKENLDHPELRDFKNFVEKYSTHPKIHVLGFVEDEDLVGLYNLASVFLFPSFYEGFGLPILEAQACGIPVITSKNSSLIEVSQDSVFYVDPKDSTQISEAINKLMHSDKLRKKLVDKGFENVKRFSWKKVADETINVYEKALYP